MSTQPVYGILGEGFSDVVEFEGFDDGHDQFHDRPPCAVEGCIAVLPYRRRLRWGGSRNINTTIVPGVKMQWKRRHGGREPSIFSFHIVTVVALVPPMQDRIA